MAWETPVYDRTAADIANKTAKAYRNASDVNRLEGNCEELAALLGVSITTDNWTREDLPDESEFARILQNIQDLRDAYYIRTDTPSTPAVPLTTYQKMNAAEKILADLYAIYNENLEAIVYAGEAYLGETIGVI